MIMTLKKLAAGAAMAFGLAAASAHASSIVSTTGGIVILGNTLPSGVITANWLVNGNSGLTKVVFDEVQNYTLNSPLIVDAGQGVIAAGTVISSELVFFNNVSSTPSTSSVTFNNPVLGVEYREDQNFFSPSLFTTDFLGRVGESYNLLCIRCGFETNDTLSISGNTVTFFNKYDTPGDYARVIVAGGVPEPSSWALMLLGLGALGAAMRGARRKPAMAR